MDIQEVRARARALEKEIVGLINLFEKDTSVKVTAVTIETYAAHDSGGDKHVIRNEATIRTEI